MCTARSRLSCKENFPIPVCLHQSQLRSRLPVAASAGRKQRQQQSIPALNSERVVTSFVVPLFVAGSVCGTLLDGIHGTVHLLEYKAAAYDIGGLHSSLWVAPLLGAYYAVVGPLQVFLDSIASGSVSARPLAVLQSWLCTQAQAEATSAAQQRATAHFVALNSGVLAASLFLSAVLYKQELPYGQIIAILALIAAVNWKLFDQTRQGLLLAFFCALAAPVSELVIINVLGFWQYPRPDLFGKLGVPSWVTCCYFFYTPALGNLSRLLWNRLKD